MEGEGEEESARDTVGVLIDENSGTQVLQFKYDETKLMGRGIGVVKEDDKKISRNHCDLTVLSENDMLQIRMWGVNPLIVKRAHSESCESIKKGETVLLHT